MSDIYSISTMNSLGIGFHAEESELPPSVASPFLSPVLLLARDQEVQIILQAYQRAKRRTTPCYNNSSHYLQELVLIRGKSGTGKTALVSRTLPSVVENDGGCFLVGKFEPSTSRKIRPYAVFVAAFTQYAEMIFAKYQHLLEEIRNSLQSVIGSEGRLLTDMIPPLERFIGKQGDPSNVKGNDALNRFHFVFGNFCRAISKITPLVLFFDDLQWGDPASLTLLQSLLLSPLSKGEAMLIVATYRDDEGTVGRNDPGRRLSALLPQHRPSLIPQLAPFEMLLHQLGLSSTLHITEIALANMDLVMVDQVLANLLKHSDTMRLARLVHTHTDGNFFHVFQFLQYLFDKGLLHVDEDTNWVWDHMAIQSEVESSETCVHEIVRRKVDSLPTLAREILKMAACMGAEIDDSALSLVLGYPTICKHLEQAADKRLLTFYPQFGGYRFSHDGIQQAVYSMIDDPEEMYLRLGRKLWKASNPIALENNIYVVVNLLSKGERLMTDQRERYRVAGLNLQAGEKAMLLSAFPDASRYLGHGINLLKRVSESTNDISGSGGVGNGQYWVEEYELSLALHECAAEAEVCVQNFERVRELIGQVFEHARCFNDKLRSYSALISSMGQQDNLQEATNIGLEVLAQLGEPMPKEVTKITLMTEFTKTRMALRGKSDQELLNLPPMVDETKLACTHILNMMFINSTQAMSPHAFLLSFRLIRLSLKYGLSEGTAQAFSSFGIILIAFAWDIKRAYRFGQLAISLVEKTQSKEALSRVYLNMYSGINHWIHNVHESLGKLLYASRVGMETGDVQIAHVTLCVQCTMLLHGGTPLPEVETSCMEAIRRMQHYKQENSLLLTKVVLQMVHNLTGRAENPVRLAGEIVEFDAILKEALDTNFLLAASRVYLYSAELAYLFGDYETAWNMFQEMQKWERYPTALFSHGVRHFREGLVCIALARQGIQKRQNIHLAKQVLSKMSRWAKLCPANFAHKKLMMEAELKSLEGTFSSANPVLALYDKAILSAMNEGFLNEAALGWERAGDYMHLAWNDRRADECWERAHDLYIQWGATYKATHLKSFTQRLV